MRKYLDVIKSSRLFRDIDDGEIEAMLACLSVSSREYAKNEFILRAGERSSSKSLMTRFSMKMVGMQQCVAVLPLPILQPDLCEELVTVPLEPVIPWEIAIIRRREGYRSFAATQLFDHICEHFAALEGGGAEELKNGA